VALKRESASTCPTAPTKNTIAKGFPVERIAERAAAG
jgi:hypothetical protein